MTKGRAGMMNNVGLIAGEKNSDKTSTEDRTSLNGHKTKSSNGCGEVMSNQNDFDERAAQRRNA